MSCARQDRDVSKDKEKTNMIQIGKEMERKHNSGGVSNCGCGNTVIGSGMFDERTTTPTQTGGNSI